MTVDGMLHPLLTPFSVAVSSGPGTTLPRQFDAVDHSPPAGLLPADVGGLGSPSTQREDGRGDRHGAQQDLDRHPGNSASGPLSGARHPGLPVRADRRRCALRVVRGAVEPVAQRLGDDVGHRNRAPRREIRLALARVLAPHERVAHADPLRLPVNIAPAQPQQLRLPQTGERRDQDDDPQHRPQHVGRRRRRQPTSPTTHRRRHNEQRPHPGSHPGHGATPRPTEKEQVRVGIARAPALGTVARRTGFSAAHRLSIACSKTECRKVMTLRTVFGAEPSASMCSARSSTSVCVTRSTGFDPSRGEMCTRCIDSQPCRYDVRQPSIFSLRRSESVASSTVRRSEVERIGVRSSSSCILRNRRSASARVSPSEVPLTRALPTLRFSLRPSAVRQRP